MGGGPIGWGPTGYDGWVEAAGREGGRFGWVRPISMLDARLPVSSRLDGRTS